MLKNEAHKPWELRALGDLTPQERAEFYEDLSKDNPEEHFFGFDSDSKLYENPRLEVGIMLANGAIVPFEKYPKTKGLRDTYVDVYLDRYFVQAMPGRQFDLQLAVSSRHLFDGHEKPDLVSHTLAVHGVLGDYTNYLAEPVFQRLKVADMLSLDIAVTFLTDRSTERLIQFLKGPELRQGIQLAGAYNPVFGTVATYVRGVLESLAEAKKNQVITDGHVTLMASPGQISPPLIEGTYVFFQPSTEAEDSMARKPRYDSDRQRIALEDGDFERNHMILRVMRHS